MRDSLTFDTRSRTRAAHACLPRPSARPAQACRLQTGPPGHAEAAPLAAARRAHHLRSRRSACAAAAARYRGHTTRKDGMGRHGTKGTK